MIRITWPSARRLRTHRPGQAVVEMALIAPILLLIVLGIVEFARAWSAHHIIADATREGARLAAIADEDIGPTEVREAVMRALANGGLDGSTAEESCPSADGGSCIEVSDNDDVRGMPSTVHVEYAYRMVWLAPFMNWATGDETITLKGRTVMRNE